jgi:hypothetical protein
VSSEAENQNSGGVAGEETEHGKSRFKHLNYKSSYGHSRDKAGFWHGTKIEHTMETPQPEHATAAVAPKEEIPCPEEASGNRWQRVFTREKTFSRDTMER